MRGLEELSIVTASTTPIASQERLDTALLVAAVAALDKLTALDLSGAPFVSDALLKALATIVTHLERLDLSRCADVGNEGLSAILGANASTLRVVKLSGTMEVQVQRIKRSAGSSSGGDGVSRSASGSTRENLRGQMTVLRGSPKVSYSSLVPFIKASKRVEELHLEHSLTSPHDLSIDSIVAPAFLSQLRVLRLLGCYSVSDKHLVEIAKNASRLVELSLGSKIISNTGLIAIGGASFASNLQYLALRGLSTAEEAFVALLKNLRSIRSLSIYGCFGLTDVSLAALAPDQGCLKELALSGCENVLGYSFRSLLKSSNKIEVLDLSFTQPMKDQAVAFISSLRTLRSLDISHCPSLNSDAAVLEFLPALPWLSSLSLISQKDITGAPPLTTSPLLIFLLLIYVDVDETVKQLALTNRRLEELNVGDCSALTDRALIYLEAIKGLRALHLYHLPQLSLKRITELQNTLLHLDTLTLPRFSARASLGMSQ